MYTFSEDSKFILVTSEEHETYSSIDDFDSENCSSKSVSDNDSD